MCLSYCGDTRSFSAHSWSPNGCETKNMANEQAAAALVNDPSFIEYIDSCRGNNEREKGSMFTLNDMISRQGRPFKAVFFSEQVDLSQFRSTVRIISKDPARQPNILLQKESHIFRSKRSAEQNAARAMLDSPDFQDLMHGPGTYGWFAQTVAESGQFHSAAAPSAAAPGPAAGTVPAATPTLGSSTQGDGALMTGPAPELHSSNSIASATAVLSIPTTPSGTVPAPGLQLPPHAGAGPDFPWDPLSDDLTMFADDAQPTLAGGDGISEISQSLASTEESSYHPTPKKRPRSAKKAAAATAAAGPAKTPNRAKGSSTGANTKKQKQSAARDARAAAREAMQQEQLSDARALGKHCVRDK